MSASWTLIGPDGALYQSARPGNLGGHRRSKLYGRLDCRSALQALAPRRLRARPRLLSRRARRPSRGLPAMRGLPARPVRSMEDLAPRDGLDIRERSSGSVGASTPSHPLDPLSCPSVKLGRAGRRLPRRRRALLGTAAAPAPRGYRARPRRASLAQVDPADATQAPGAYKHLSGGRATAQQASALLPWDRGSRDDALAPRTRAGTNAGSRSR